MICQFNGLCHARAFVVTGFAVVDRVLTFGDIVVTVAATNATTITLTAVSVKGTAVTTPADTWTIPVQ